MSDYSCEFCSNTERSTALVFKVWLSVVTQKLCMYNWASVQTVLSHGKVKKENK